MAISDKLLLLNNTKQQIRQAIESLGYTVGDIPFSQYPNVIEGGDLFQQGQTLNYNFTNQRYGTRLPDGTIDYTTNINDLGILTRASTATYWGPEGSLLEAAVDDARIQHDPVTGKPLGVLIEPAATNECRFSEDFSAWPHHRARTESGYSAPDGSNTASRVFADYSGTESRGARLSLDYGQFQDDSGRSISGFFKAGTYNHVYLSRTQAGTALQSMTVNLITGEVQTNGSIREAKATHVGDGWWRVQASFDYTRWQNPVFYLSSYIGSSDSGWYGDDHTPNDGEYIYAWGFQFEQSPYPTSYIPTSGSPATRAADSGLVVPVSGLLPSDEVTFGIEFYLPSNATSSGYTNLITLRDSSINNRNHASLLFRSNRWGSIGRNYSLRETTWTGMRFGPGNLNRGALSFSETDSYRSTNGSVSRMGDGGGVGLSMATTLHAASHAANYANAALMGHVSRMYLFPRVMTEAELIELTTISEEE